MNVLATVKIVSRYNGVLYHDMALGCVVRLGGLYCKRVRCIAIEWAVRLCCNTLNFIVIEEVWLGGRLCHDTNIVS